MRSSISLMVMAALLVLLWGGPARAQPSEGRGGRDGAKAAQMHYRRGRAHHERGEHQAAVREYLIAYELSQSPRLLFNIAQVYLLADNPQKALTYYEAFVDREPRGKISDLARQRIAELRKRRRRERPAAPEGAQGGDAARGNGSAGAGHAGAGTREGPGTGVAAGASGADVAGAAGATGAAGSPGSAAAGGSPLDRGRGADTGPGRAGRGMRMTGLVALGLGAVGVGAGVGFGLQAHGKQQEIDDQPEGTPWTFDEVYDQGRAANRNMWIAYGAGAAALVAGGVLYYLGWSAGRAEAQSWAIAPLAGTSAAGITFLGEL